MPHKHKFLCTYLLRSLSNQLSTLVTISRTELSNFYLMVLHETVVNHFTRSMPIALLINKIICISNLTLTISRINEMFIFILSCKMFGVYLIILFIFSQSKYK